MTMLHLRIITPADRTQSVVDVLSGHSGATHVIVLPAAARQPAGDVVLCDVVREAATPVLERLRALGIDGQGGVLASDEMLVRHEEVVREGLERKRVVEAEHDRCRVRFRRPASHQREDATDPAVCSLGVRSVDAEGSVTASDRAGRTGITHREGDRIVAIKGVHKIFRARKVVAYRDPDGRVWPHPDDESGSLQHFQGRVLRSPLEPKPSRWGQLRPSESRTATATANGLSR
ncbi:MAG: hypothetical protein ACRDT4_07875 [Micromonosporaceae bacterium]